MEERRWLLAEMHCHTTNSDGKLTPEEVVALYEKEGYDVLAITDHDFFTEVSSKKMVIIPACEWTVATAKPFFNGHLLMYFLKEAPISVEDAFSLGALICVAHPAIWPWWKKWISRRVKGYEVFNLRLYNKLKPIGKIANNLSSFWYSMFYKVRVAGADAHTKKEYTKLKFWIWAKPELEDIKKALLRGEVKIEH